MNPEITPLEGRLPILHSTGRTRWQLVDESWRGAATRSAEIIERPERIPAGNLFKQGERRLIFRLDDPHPRHPGVVVKSFPLALIRHRLKAQKYAPTETANLLVAKDRGLPVPTVFACGVHRQLGLVSWNAILIQLMPGRPLKERLSNADPAVQRELLWRVLPLFKKVYETGCNHIDFGPHAILLDDAMGDSLIDFQYCRFLDQPSPRTFAALVGYFGWCLTTHWNLTPPPLIHEWYEALLDYVQPGERNALGEIFRHRLVNRASSTERLAG